MKVSPLALCLGLMLPIAPLLGQVPKPFFVDATTATGLEFVHDNGMQGERYMIENMGGGGALFDADGDGDLDLYLVQGGPFTGEQAGASNAPSDRLYRNDLEIGTDGSRKVRFVDITLAAGIHATGYGMGAAAGDIDNDGDIDLYVTNWGSNQLWRNDSSDGKIRFTEITTEANADDPRWSVPAVFYDQDRDGWLDLYIGNYLVFSLADHKPCTSLGGARDYCAPQVFEALPGRLLRNRGAAKGARFVDVSSVLGLAGVSAKALGAAAFDHDGDGTLELYVASDSLPNHLLVERDGKLEDEALLAGCAVNGEGLSEASMGVVVADLDHDGDEDLVLAHLGGETHTLYRNDGGFFEDATVPSGLGRTTWEATGFGAAALDVENDGDLDLLFANGSVKTLEPLARAGDPYPLGQRDQLFLSRLVEGGKLRFEEASAEDGGRAGAYFAEIGVSRGLLVGDVDNDGDRDAVVVRSHGPARVLLNATGQDAAWVGLRVVEALGDGASRDAYGAWVEVRRPGGASIGRRVRADGSYAAALDPRILVGLGASNEKTVEARVRWLDGTVEVWSGVAVGRYTTLRSGEGKASTAPEKPQS